MPNDRQLIRTSRASLGAAKLGWHWLLQVSKADGIDETDGVGSGEDTVGLALDLSFYHHAHIRRTI